MADRSERYLTGDFKTWVTELMTKNHIPGFSIAVVDAGHVESTGYGFAQLPDVPATPDTLWRMASTSKAHGAAVMGMLIHDSKTASDKSSSDGELIDLSWRTPIRKVLGEDFDLCDEYMSHNVTIEDALSHRSGLSGHNLNYGPWLGDRPRDLTKTLRFLGPHHHHPLRTQFQYCNLMFAVIADVIETVTQRTFDDATRDRLWNPLGMSSTLSGFYSSAPVYEDVKSGRKVLARGYHWIDDKNNEDSDGSSPNSNSRPGYYIPEPHLDGTITGSAGNITSSVKDYGKWIAALLAASKGAAVKKEEDTSKKPTITHKLWNELTTARMIVPPYGMYPDVNPVISTDTSPQLYALGWFCGSFMYPGETILQHAGGIHGFGSHVFLLPKHDFGIVVVGNTLPSSGRLAEQVGRELIGLKIGVTQDERRLEGSFASDAKLDKTGDKNMPSNTAQLDSLTQAVDNLRSENGSMSALLQSQTGLQPIELCGTYNHGAYGELMVSVAPSSTWLGQCRPMVDNARVIRKGESGDTKARKDGSKSSSDELVLRASLQGDRCFHDALLLHYQPISDMALQKREANFWTLEVVTAHGTLMNDVVSGLAQGHGRPDDLKYPFRVEGIWESTEGVPCGACFRVDPNTGKISLGMILGSTESAEAAMRKSDERKKPLKDYEDKMVWFVKQ